jgi:hypothetical protein
MGKGEGGNEAREEQSQHDEDDSEDDHGVDLISMRLCREELGRCVSV